MPEEGVGQQEIQKWNVKYEISGRDSKIWRPPRGVEPTQGEFSDPEIEEEAGHDQEEVTAEDADLLNDYG
jgi:hypothetical protein